MLTRLVINDVVLIEKLGLDLKTGLNVFTGETGAGKSIVLDALGLALGGRSEAGLIRASATQASVTAEFSLSPKHEALALAKDQGLGADPTLILRRVIGKDGKSRAFINDQPISIGLLRQFGELLLQIHGQFEAYGLLNPVTHRGLLDAFGDLYPLGQKTATIYAKWRAADEAQRVVLAERDRAKAEEDFLRAALMELDDLAPEGGETEALAVKRSALQHREKILEALQMAEQALNGERSATSALAQAGKAVARVADKAPELSELLATIDQASSQTEEASQKLDRFLAHLDADPDALQHIEERLFALRACARKHGVQPENLPNLRQELAEKLVLLSNQSDQLSALAKEAAAAQYEYIKLAEDLSAKRKKAAEQLSKAVMQELPPLKLERAQFQIEIASLPQEQWSANGIDKVTFLAATNPGMAPGPLQKIASGGELARFMLALKVVLAESDPVPTLVFDEVDAGIGGATASAVGERLARLAKHVQILVVTHSPQVAARGTYHLRVSKEMKTKQAVTAVEILDDTSRREEIARMLAGTQVTDAARKAAISLIEDTGPMKKTIKRARA